MNEICLSHQLQPVKNIAVIKTKIQYLGEDVNIDGLASYKVTEFSENTIAGSYSSIDSTTTVDFITIPYLLVIYYFMIAKKCCSGSVI